MTRVILTLLCVLVCLARAEEDGSTATTTPDAGGVLIDPSKGSIESGSTFTFTFPAAMVEPDRIDAADQPRPFVSEPDLEGDYVWKSQTEGVLTVRGIKAGTTYRFSLAPQLADAHGLPVNAPGWGAEFTSPAFSLSTDFEQRERLGSRPQMPLEATYDVRFTEVAECSYFQDRESRERYPVAVIQTDEGPPEGREFRVTPRAPLPAGRTFDLIVDGLLDAKGRQPLRYLQAFPAGTTAPLQVEWVGAFNNPLETPEIDVKFNDEINPAEVTAETIRVEPAITGLQLLPSKDEVVLRGDFDLAQHYRVKIAPQLKGERGYGLATESVWGATFRPKPAGLVFPGPTLFLRARQELRVPLLQINTPAVTWKLARIPLEKLGAVQARLSEFQKEAVNPLTAKPVVDARTGGAEAYPTELLVDAFSLPVINSGALAASSGDAETLRQVRCAAANGDPLSGPYLFEASAPLADGRVTGNRAIVFAGDFILTEKQTPTAAVVRVAKMADARPVPAVTVRAVTAENIELGRAVTDGNGLAAFPRALLFPARAPHAVLYIADTAIGPAVRLAGAGDAYGSGNPAVQPAPNRRAAIITDRNLYRPGQVVKMKGMMRDATATSLSIPKARDVRWRVVQGDGDRVVGEGNATLSDVGGWEAEWNVPKEVPLGSCQIRCQTGGADYAGPATIDIQEYRVPLFSVIVEARPEVGTVAHVRVSSSYFHGAPNAGAHVHWKATWTASAEVGDGDFRRYNAYPEVGPRLDPEGEPIKSIEGDAKLDGFGSVSIGGESPFKTNAAIGRFQVTWRAEVTSSDGQTITGGTGASLLAGPVRLGIRATEQPGPQRGVKVDVEALDPEDQPAGDIPIRVDLFHVVTKTAKEQVAPLVYRYRNVDQFTKVASQEAKTPGDLVFAVAETGRYVAAASAAGPATPLVSNETTVTGEEPAELPVENETGFEIDHPAGPFLPGDTAVLTTKAPITGIAWVTVETDNILDSLLVPVAGNAGRIELPIKAAYGPNAFVSVYLTRPGGDRDLPHERYAYTEIAVRRPDRELDIQASLSSATVRPGDTLHGEVRVTSNGQPVPDADLTVFAVDDAVLQLGDWHLPDLTSAFYPPNPFGVRSFPSLSSFQEDIPRKSLTQKGFVIGDGDEEKVGSIRNVRKEFCTLAFWQGSLKTDAQGETAFAFAAPDNLTTYRVIVVGQTREGRFGGNAAETVKVSKPLLVEAALPRFLRDGDEVELRAVARQSFSESVEVRARCVTDAACQLTAAGEQAAVAHRDTPAVFRFRAKVADPGLVPAGIRFEVRADPKMADAVELTLPVQAPTIIRKESVTGRITGPVLNPPSVMPEPWKQGHGKLDVTVSTSPYLPEIAALPAILEYPHGCFEQISTRLLGYAMLGDFLAYLPGAQTREVEYRAVIEHGLQQLDGSLLEGGMLPYWPGGTSGHAFVTALAGWAVNEAAEAGFTVPERLAGKLAEALARIVQGRAPASPFEKVFAFFVLAQRGTDDQLSESAADLYLHRNETGDEGRALLALALDRLGLLPDEKKQALREITGPVEERAFDPVTFSSTTRAEAICALALNTVAAQIWDREQRNRVRDRLFTLMAVSPSFSTQENLWLLLAFKSMLGTDKGEPLKPRGTKPLLSKNGRSAAWLDVRINDPAPVQVLNRGPLTFLLKAEYTTDKADTDRVDRGFRVERVLRDLTDPKRTGDPGAPFRLGDQILVTYRIHTRKQQCYVALEDALPAGLETVNPDLAMIGKFFEISPEDATDRALSLSHSEMRDRSTLLYFDAVAPGPGTYSVLARATAAGTFRWPATQVIPMYDSRFSGLSPASVCVVSGD